MRLAVVIVLSVVLWLLLLPFWALWQLFSELCDWVDRRGQRRFAKTMTRNYF